MVISSASLYHGFSMFAAVGVVGAGTMYLVAPEIGMTSQGLDGSTPLNVRLYMAAGNWAWFVAKYNAYKSGPTVHKQYFQLALPSILLWLASTSLESSRDINPMAYGFPALMIPFYIYYGYIFDYDTVLNNTKNGKKL